MSRATTGSRALPLRPRCTASGLACAGNGRCGSGSMELMILLDDDAVTRLQRLAAPTGR